MQYQSSVEIRSATVPGVVFRVRKMSFSHRLNLMKDVRDLASRHEFLKAGPDPLDQLEAQRIEQEIALVYLNWGLVSVDGLEIDGEAATAARLIELGPEDLVREALSAVINQLGLSEEERKN
ncbi:MAG: hypothetical protein JNL98_11145 [Bryobacterales bacterium]|nr:hypothetical protein [Bryobacterales bacterium]